MMWRRSWLLGAAALLAGTAAWPADSNRVLVATTSSSREFVAYSPDRRLSSVLCAFAEQIKREWLQRLALEDNWRDPITIVMRERKDEQSAAGLTAEMFLIDSRIKYRLTLVVPPAPDDTAFTAAVIELLCAEVANRGQPRQPGSEQLAAPVPVWLSEGLAQGMRGQIDQLLAVTRRSASSARPQTAMEVMRVTKTPEDPADRGLYRANAWLLTEGLLRLPDGTRKIQALLKELGATKVFAAAFGTVYADDFPDTAALESWWSEQLRQAREDMVAENLSATDTARRLDAILAIKVEPRPAFDQLWRYSDQPWVKPVLLESLAGLEALKTYGHPLYRPVVARYSEGIRQLLDRNTTRFRRATREGDRLRKAVDQQVREIQETVDRAERIYATVETNEFAGFFRTLEQLQQFEQQRRNPISDYLDQFDK